MRSGQLTGAATRAESYGVRVAEIDLSRLPTGELGWSELVDFVRSSDDRIERYFLEVKSEADLNTKADRAKVAKFILGAPTATPTVRAVASAAMP
jgi:hypothetical protein